MGTSEALALGILMSRTYKAFAGLEADRHKKRELAEQLIRAFVEENCELVIVKTRPSLCEFFRRHSLTIIRSPTLMVYSITCEEHINEGSELMARIRLWHKPIFHLVIGKRGFSAKMIEIYRSSTKGMIHVERMLEEDIVCAIDPLDHDLVCYGSRLSREIVTTRLKSYAYLIE